MKIIIIYDSVFGNTGKIAQAVYTSITEQSNIYICKPSEIKYEQLYDIDLLIVGSPTNGFRPTPSIIGFLKNIPNNCLEGTYVAAFDTRFSISDLNSSFVKFIVKTGGYASKSIASQLVKKGGQLIISPEGFLVKTDKGPLLAGELERASKWVKNIEILIQKSTHNKIKT